MTRPAPALLQVFTGALSAYRGGRLEQAERLCEQLVAARPDFFDALHLLAVVQSARGSQEMALASYDRALSLRPDHVDALNNRGVTLQRMQRYDEALASCERAIALRPDDVEALNNRGAILKQLGRFDEALVSLERVLALQPEDAEVLVNHGAALHELKRYGEALASYARALTLRPDYAGAYYNCGLTLTDLKRYDEALACYERTVALQADFDRAFVGAWLCASQLCNWEARARTGRRLLARLETANLIVSPFVLLGLSGDPVLQRRCAERYSGHCFPTLPQPLSAVAGGEAGKPRRKLCIAYLSADFRSHPAAYLSAGLFEQHDRSRFEITGVSFGMDDGSPIRKRLVAGFDRFLEVREVSDRDTARLLHELQVDIAVDLMGHTRDARPGILACRPAPIQVLYLGYLGTTGSAFIDYIIADRIVAPFEHQPCYTEKIVHLPDSYQVSDDKREIGEDTPSRSQMGLPGQGLVFCCFNNTWKLSPALFDIWMRLLRQVAGSVLWLLQDNEAASANLRREAQKRGVDPSRLVFAPRAEPAAHLARHRLADLFLDTLPCNAGATASDALWAGLPVLTCLGESFAGRVAASLLAAAGLPELITASLADYEAQALRLARDPALLAELKERLARNRGTTPLFDTARYTRHLEAAYEAMWAVHVRGEAPGNITVAPL